MASITEDMKLQGDTQDNTFDFEDWIAENKLEEIKQCFIDYDMTTLNTLNIRNENYSKLIGDSRVISKAHSSIHVTIHKAMLTLDQDNGNKIIVLTSNERNALENVQNNIKDLQQRKELLQTIIYSKFENSKQMNNEQINEYKISVAQKLGNIKDEMNKTFDELRGNFNKIKSELYEKVSEYENRTSQSKSKYKEHAINMEKTLQNTKSMIETDIKYYKGLLKKCADIASKYNDAKENYSLIHVNQQRVNEIAKIGTKSTHYFEERLISFNNHENIINQYIDTDLQLTDKCNILLNIDDNIQQQIINDIQLLIQFNDQ